MQKNVENFIIYLKKSFRCLTRQMPFARLLVYVAMDTTKANFTNSKLQNKQFRQTGSDIHLNYSFSECQILLHHNASTFPQIHPSFQRRIIIKVLSDNELVVAPISLVQLVSYPRVHLVPVTDVCGTYHKSNKKKRHYDGSRVSGRTVVASHVRGRWATRTVHALSLSCLLETTHAFTETQGGLFQYLHAGLVFPTAAFEVGGVAWCFS